MVQWRGALERGSYQRDEGRAHQGERRELEREPLYGPGGEPHQRARRRREDFSEGPAGDNGEGHCAVHPSAIHTLSIQGPSCPYLVHPAPKGNQKLRTKHHKLNFKAQEHVAEKLAAQIRVSNPSRKKTKNMSRMHVCL